MAKTIVMLLLLSFTAYAAPDWGSVDYGNTSEAQADGKSLANTVKGYNSSSDIQDRLQSPIMGGREMTTLDTSYQCGGAGGIYEDLSVCNSNCATGCDVVRFDAAIECARNVEAVVIKPFAVFAGGEIALQVDYDSNLDGVLDQNFTSPNISGFCVNGIMSCTAETLDNCDFYEFAVPYKCSVKEEVYANINDCLDVCGTGTCSAQSSYVSLVKSKQEHVGRCDCTNSSCGKSFNSTFDSSMAIFGAGIVNHMVNSLNLSVSKTNVDASTLSVSYMAMTAGVCGEEGVDIAKLKQGSSTGTPDYTGTLMEATKDPDSIYNLVTADTSVTEGQCETINSVVLAGSGLSVSKSIDACQLSADCTIDKEYACEPVCPPNSIYTQGKCELYNYSAGYFMCPTGFQFGRYNAALRGFEALPTADGATVCFRQISNPHWTIRNRVYMCYTNEYGGLAGWCRSALSASNKLSLNIPKGVIDPEIWPTATIYSYAYNGAAYTNLRLYPNGERISNWNDGNYEKSFTSVNGQVLPTDVYVERTDYRNSIVYQTIPSSQPTGDGLDIVYHQNMTDWLGYDNIGVTTYLAVTATLRQKQCPNGWYLENGKCYQNMKPLSALKCNEVKSEVKEDQHCAYVANSTALVCGNGQAFYKYDTSGNSSTSSGSGRFVTKKRYTCTQVRQKYDYSEITEARKNTVIHEVNGGYILSYKDETGANRTIDLDGQYNENGCQKSCQVVALDSSSTTQVTHEGKPITSSDNFASRICIDNVCPYDPTIEKVTQDCTCTQIDDFGKVISILGVLEESTKDKICVQ